MKRIVASLSLLIFSVGPVAADDAFRTGKPDLRSMSALAFGPEGVLFVGGKPTGYYKIGAASFGLQAGGQSFSYALFLMNDKALTYLRKSDGWAIGSGPSVVVVDKGAAMSTTSTTIAKDVYAFPFGQKGLMAGLGLEGSKISPIRR